MEIKEVFNLSDIILGNVAGRSLSHVWYDEDGQDKVVYSGKFEKLKRSKTYVMAYSLLKKGVTATHLGVFVRLFRDNTPWSVVVTAQDC